MAKKTTRGASVVDSLREHLAIDKHALDIEIQRQPSLFYEISEAYVKAASRRDFLKEEIARVDADLNARHRRKIEKSGARATENSVGAAITADPKHQKAVDAHIAARNEAELLQALKEAFHQRSYMLRDMVALFVANYYEKGAVEGTNVTRDFKANKNIDRMAEARAAKGSRDSRRARKRE